MRPWQSHSLYRRSPRRVAPRDDTFCHNASAPPLSFRARQGEESSLRFLLVSLIEMTLRLPLHCFVRAGVCEVSP